MRAAEIASLDYARTHYDAGAEMVFADDRIVLDEFFDESDAMSIDFMKVDIDGHDSDDRRQGLRLRSFTVGKRGRRQRLNAFCPASRTTLGRDSP